MTSADLPHFAATGLGVVSYLEGAQATEDGTPVAEVRLTTEGGEAQTFVLRAGQETAEGIYQGKVAHAQARVGHRWRADTAESERTIEGNDYVAQLHWGMPLQMAHIEIVALPFGKQIHIRGLALIDARDGSNVPLILSNEGRFRQVHSGDVKVYEVLNALPRAHVVHHTRVIA
ncbi:MAG: hypothetical protein GTO49_35290, partial [Anaerolineae bacterium]|nr:hypothetical protein [Anaerolineae bacterium]